MRARLRRSCLTVPGDDERKLAKASGLAVDEVILDLEDAVAAERKDEARETAARAFGVAAVDGPFPVLDDAGGLRASALRSRRFGYEGKWCIHPAQIAICNEVYTPTDAEVDRARRILGIDGVARLDGEMVDAANRRMAESILARLPGGPHEKGHTDD